MDALWIISKTVIKYSAPPPPLHGSLMQKHFPLPPSCGTLEFKELLLFVYFSITLYHPASRNSYVQDLEEANKVATDPFLPNKTTHVEHNHPLPFRIIYTI